MKGIRDQLKLFRQLAQSLESRIKRSGLVNKETKAIASQLRFTGEIATPIYDAVGPDIGRLWRKMARRTAEFYADVHSLGILGKIISECKRPQLRPLVMFYVWESESLVKEAQEIAGILDDISQGKGYPDDEDRRKKASKCLTNLDLTGFRRLECICDPGSFSSSNEDSSTKRG